MKKVILSIMLVLASAGAIQAEKVSLTTKGDTMVMASSDDTVQVVAPTGLGATVQQQISRMLDDTLVGAGVDAEAVMSPEQQKAEFEIEKERMVQKRLTEEQEMSQVAKITSIVFASIVVIMTLAFFFFYLHRRAKYRVIEKAIENNYPLSGTTLSGAGFNSYAAEPQPYVVSQPVQQEAPVADPTQPQQAAQQTASPHYVQGRAVINWNAFRPSFTLIAVGLGLMFFFAVTNTEEMAALCSIIFFVGVVRAAIIYMNYRNGIAPEPRRPRGQQPQYYQQPQQQYYQQPQHSYQQPQQPAQPQQPEPPVFNADAQPGANGEQPQQ